MLVDHGVKINVAW